MINLVYEPTLGSLLAHQIGMSCRIVYIAIFAYFLLTLIFEWGGSFAIGRPVQEILVGWNVFAGYLWPFVLLSYLLSPFIVGIAFHPGKTTR